MISPPSSMTYIQKYSHSMIITIVVRLPYILEKPLKISMYTENIKDASVHPNAVKIAPGN